MKILELSPYAYFKGKKGFKKNRSGFAYAVSDTCKALADNGDDVYLITQSAITNGFEDDGVIIPRKRWKDILINVSISDFSLGIQAIKGYHAKYVAKLKVIYYFLNTGYVKKQIRLIDPDIIHQTNFRIKRSVTGKKSAIEAIGISLFCMLLLYTLKFGACIGFLEGFQHYSHIWAWTTHPIMLLAACGIMGGKSSTALFYLLRDDILLCRNTRII